MFDKWYYRISICFLFVAIVGLGIMTFGCSYRLGGGLIAIGLSMALLVAALPILK
jgi:hypothetical protein